MFQISIECQRRASRRTKKGGLFPPFLRVEEGFPPSCSLLFKETILIVVVAVFVVSVLVVAVVVLIVVLLIVVPVVFVLASRVKRIVELILPVLIVIVIHAYFLSGLNLKLSLYFLLSSMGLALYVKINEKSECLQILWYILTGPIRENKKTPVKKRAARSVCAIRKRRETA